MKSKFPNQGLTVSEKNTHNIREYNRKQHLFIKYTFAVLVDLVVLNLFNQYSEHVFIESFSISLLVAVLLQILLQGTLVVEHRVADYFKTKPGVIMKILRGLSTWAILFISKLVILKVIALLFGESIVFSGPLHGVVMFIIVVIAIIVAEQTIIQVNKKLAD